MHNFANFAPTQEQVELAALNRRKFNQAKATGDRTAYNQQLAQQKQAFDSARLNTATEGAQAATQAKQAAAAEARRVKGLGVLGKAKHYGGKALGKVAGVGGMALNAAFILPQVASLLPQNQQPQPQPQDYDDNYRY
jgi:hypothetical protein